MRFRGSKQQNSHKSFPIFPIIFIAVLYLFLLSIFVAPARAAIITINGAPLNIYSSESGNLQARFDGVDDNVFYPPWSYQGDAGFFLGFPSGTLADTVYGPTIVTNSSFLSFTQVSQDAVTGAGTVISPYTQQTVYLVKDGSENEYAEITQIISYVNGESRFKMSYAVKNITNPPVALRFRAIAAADLYLEGSDFGTGFLSLGPPRFVAGANHTTGKSGGIEEVNGSTWDKHQVAYYYDLWGVVTDPLAAGFANTLVETLVDNGLGVQWDNHYGDGNGLSSGATTTYEIIWQFASFVPLRLDPLTDTDTVGDTHRITATVMGISGDPSVGKSVRYTIAGSHPRTAA